jgi:hypothetical protein
MPQTTTLLHYLTQANPEVETRWRSLSQSETKGDDYPDLRKLALWEDFQLETIVKMFDHKLSNLLMERYDNLPNMPKLRPSSLELYLEACVQDVVTMFNQEIVLEALDKTTPRRDFLGQEVWMLRGSKTRVKWKTKLAPDWAGRSQLEFENNILPGDTKMSKNFDSDSILEAVTEGEEIGRNLNHLWPIRQVLWYCYNTGMRYGYIITDKELIVLRVGTYEEKEPPTFEDLRTAIRKKSRVEWRAIPWDNSGNELTINLALWTLHILAANNGLLDWKYGKLEDEKLVPYASQTQLQPDPNGVSQRMSFAGNLRGLMLDSFGSDSQLLSQPAGKRKLESEPSDDNAPRRRRRTTTKEGLEAQ